MEQVQHYRELRDFEGIEVVVDGAREAAAILTQRFADTEPLLFRKELHMPEMWPLLGGDRLVAAAHQLVMGNALRVFPNPPPRARSC